MTTPYHSIPSLQTPLVVLLNLVPLLAKCGISGIGLETAQLLQLIDPLLTKGIADQLPQSGITVGQPTPLGYTVGLVVEFPRPEVIKIFE